MGMPRHRQARGTTEIERELLDPGEQDEFDELQRRGLIVTAAVSVVGIVVITVLMLIGGH